MTVVRNLPEQLILAHAPWLLGGMLIICIMGFSAAGLALLFAGEPSGLYALLLGAALPGGIFALAIRRDQAIEHPVAKYGKYTANGPGTLVAMAS